MTRRQIPGELRLAAPRSRSELWRACCEGREPAEALDSRDREDLVGELVARGWSVREIAVLTRMTTYTAARIAARVTAEAARVAA